MKRTFVRSLLAPAVALASLVTVSLAQGFQLVSTVDPAQGPPAGAGGDSWAPVLSPDARYVLFASTANNLLVANNGSPIPLQIPPNINVFLRDRTNGTTMLVSVNLSGVAGGNGNSWPVGLSTNGQFVLFESSASDLIPADTNGVSDVFVRDVVNGATWIVSVSTNGSVGNGASRSAAMTPDGRYIAFVSEANNLVAGDNNRIPDVFIRDLQANTTTLVSAGAVSTNSTLPSGGSEAPDLTPDGRYVCFYSTASNLVPGVPAGGDIYVRDVVGTTTVWASSYARTAVPSNSVFCFNHALSADGQYVAYEASAALSAVGTILRCNLGSGVTDVVHGNAAVPTGAYEDIRSLDLSPDGRFLAFIANTNGTTGSTTCAELWDALTDTLTLVSGDPTGQVPPGTVCDWPIISPSGQFVAFLSTSTGLTANALNGDYHLYLRDTVAGTTSLIDADTNGTGSPVSAATTPRFSSDFRFVAFECADASLVSNDRNRDYDVFLRDLVAGTNQLISAHDPALPSLSPNGPSTLATSSISSNGQYVAFASEADNLAPNDTNQCRDIFVRDLFNGTNLFVSVATNGYSGDGISSDPAISADGRYVVFSSRADNLVAGDSNQAQDVFIRDLQAGMTTLVSANNTLTGPGNGDSSALAVSSGGRFVLFRSYANNLAAGTTTLANLFLRDMLLSTNYALTSNGSFPSASGDFLGALTPDGRYAAFQSNPGLTSILYVWSSLPARGIYTNSIGSLLTGLALSSDGSRLAFSSGNSLSVVNLSTKSTSLIDTGSGYSFQRLRLSSNGQFLSCIKTVSATGGTNQVYLYDLQAATSTLVSHAYDSTSGGYGASDFCEISGDGQFVAYRSAAANIVAGDTNGVPDIFLWNRATGVTTLLSTNSSGSPFAGNRSLAPVFSGDSQTVFFESWAPGLVSQDFNQSSDLFGSTLYPRTTLTGFPLAVAPGSSPQFTWTYVPGWNYRVQYKDSLDDPVWHDLNASVTFSGPQATFQDPAPTTSQRFYRVVAY